MAQHGLDDTQVGSAFEQGCGKAVAQGVGGDGLLDACCPCILLHHDEHHRAGEVVATTVEKHIVFLTGFDVHGIAVGIP